MADAGRSTSVQGGSGGNLAHPSVRASAFSIP